MKKILLIDAFGIIFKYYYILKLTNIRGEQTSSIFGLLTNIILLLEREKPDYYLVAFESETKCFRNDIYNLYKANRQEAPFDLKSQIPRIINILKELEIPYLSINGYEADDIIGTISKKFKDQFQIIILSSDKDLRQLVDKNVVVYSPSSKASSSDFDIYNEEKVIEKYGIKPSQLIDYLALLGDPSDNIPGVKGIGEKGATTLISQWGSLENIYANLDKIHDRIKDKLITGKDKAFLSKNLVTIQCDIPLDINIENFKINVFNLQKALPLLEKENLKSIIQKIKEYNKITFGITEKIESNVERKIDTQKFKLLKDINEVKNLINMIKEEKIFAFDTETTGFDCFTDHLICITIATKDNSFLIPLKLSLFQEEECEFQLTNGYIENVRLLLKEIFEDEKILKIGHNMKFDIKFLKKFGIEVTGKIFDTMIAEYCLDTANNILNLKDLSLKYLNIRLSKYREIVNDTKNITLLDIPLKELLEYASLDAYITYRLYNILKEKLEVNEKIKNLFYIIEMPILKILVDMEFTGVNIDIDYLKKFSQELEKEIEDLTQKLIKESGEVFNPNSPKQISEIMFNKLKLPIIKETKTGSSTDMDVLKKLSLIHPFAQILLEHRMLSKLKSTYSDSLSTMVNRVTGKIHTTYMQTGTQTGRLSSKEPNLQNIPVKTEAGKKIRKAFVPDKNNILISADYSQIELFLLAEFSKDPNMFYAFNNNEDIHKKTASLIFEKKIEELTKEERNIAKTVNFGILYGQSAFALADDLNISRKEAQNFIDKYFENYSGIKKYIENIKKICKERGYAETYWGRRRTILEINSNNKVDQAYGERMAVNTTIQGSAADLIKIAMIKIYNEFKKNNIKSKLILQVHDELIFDVIKEEEDIVKKIIKDAMENDFNFELKLKVAIKKGNSWGELS